MIIAITDPRTLAAALSAQAHSTVFTRRKPVGNGIPIRKPRGASTAPLRSNLTANGRPTAAESSHGSRTTWTTMRAEIKPSSGRILLPVLIRRRAATLPAPLESSSRNTTTVRAYGMSQKKNEALDQGNFNQDKSESHSNEIKQSNDPGLVYVARAMPMQRQWQNQERKHGHDRNNQEHSKHDNAQVDAPVHAVACSGHNIFKHVTGLKREEEERCAVTHR